MSSKNNVNKDFYTMAGRDRPNEDLVPAKAPRPWDRAGRGRPQANFIPGAAPVGEVPAEPERAAGHETQSSASKTGVRSGSKKAETTGRGGKAPGKARRKAGASGEARPRRRAA